MLVTHPHINTAMLQCTIVKTEEKETVYILGNSMQFWSHIFENLP